METRRQLVSNTLFQTATTINSSNPLISLVTYYGHVREKKRDTHGTLCQITICFKQWQQSIKVVQQSHLLLWEIGYVRGRGMPHPYYLIIISSHATLIHTLTMKISKPNHR